MKLSKLILAVLFTAFISCENQPQQENETQAEDTIYSEESVQKSNNLEQDAEKLDQEIDEFVKEI